MRRKGSLKKLGRDSTYQEGYNDTFPLHHAAMTGDCPAIKKWISSDLTLVNSRDGVGKTPVLIAAEFGKAEALKLLLDKGGDFRLVADSEHRKRGTYKRSALHLGAMSDNPEVLTILFEAGANCMLKDATGNLPIHLAIKKKLIRNVRVILAHQTDINATEGLQNSGDIGMSPLQLACKIGDAPMVELLCTQTDIKIDQFDRQLLKAKESYENDQDICKTALYYAAGAECDAAVAKLVECGANPSAVGENGWTLLYTAVFEVNLPIIRTLCRLGANPLASCRYGATAFNLALEMESNEIIAIFLEYIDIKAVNSEEPLVQKFFEEVEDLEVLKKMIKKYLDEGGQITEDDVSEADSRFGSSEDEDGKFREFIRSAHTSQINSEVGSPEYSQASSGSSTPVKNVLAETSPQVAKKTVLSTESVVAELPSTEQAPDTVMLDLQQSLLDLIAEHEEEQQQPVEQQQPKEVPQSTVEKEPTEVPQTPEEPLELHEPASQVATSLPPSELGHLKEEYLKKQPNLSETEQVFFDNIGRDGFRIDSQDSVIGDNVLHLLAEDPELSGVVPIVVESLTQEQIDALVRQRDHADHSPAQSCIVHCNDHLLTSLLRACKDSALREACAMPVGSAHPSIFHLLGSRLLQQRSIKLIYDLFHSEDPVSEIPDRHILFSSDVQNFIMTQNILRFALLFISILGPEEAARQSQLKDAHGNRWLTYCCLSGSHELIASATDMLLTFKDISPSDIMSTTNGTLISPLEIIASYGQLDSLESLVSLLGSERHDFLLRQNPKFDDRNILDWQVFAPCQDDGAHKTVIKGISLSAAKLDNKLIVALNRQSKLGPLLQILVRSIPLSELTRCLSLKQLGAFELLCAMFVSAQQTAQDDQLLSLVNLVLTIPRRFLPSIKTVVTQIHNKKQNGSILRNQFMLALKDHFESTDEVYKDVTIAFMHVAYLCDVKPKFNSEQENALLIFCNGYPVKLYVALTSYQEFFKKFIQGKTFGGQVFRSQSILKKIIDSLVTEFCTIEKAKEPCFVCSPGQRLQPTDIFNQNFRTLMTNLAKIHSANELKM